MKSPRESEKVARERRIIETARQRSTYFPSGDLVRDEPPDWLNVLGAGPLRTFFRVILPLSTGSLLTGVVLSFAHTLGECGVVLMVGGNIPGVTHTASIDIYDRV